MKTFNEVHDWCVGAAEDMGDPAEVVGQMFLRWRSDLHELGNDLIACMHEDRLVLLLGRGFPVLPIPLDVEGAQIDDTGALTAFGIQKITDSVWALTPSLNVPGLIHAFAVLYDVPSPAPWERSIILPNGRAP